jgi:hypothetical protein
MGNKHKIKNGGQLPRRRLTSVPLAQAALAPVAPAPVAPAPVAPAYIADTIFRLLEGEKYDEILKLELEYCHLGTFSDDPAKDALVLYAFGTAHHDPMSKDEICLNRAIHKFERAKERIEDANANDQHQSQNSVKSLKSKIGMSLAFLYSEGRSDMEKTISSHRWLVQNCNRHEVPANYVIHLSHNFNRFDKFEYTIEVLEESMHMLDT